MAFWKKWETSQTETTVRMTLKMLTAQTNFFFKLIQDLGCGLGGKDLLCKFQKGRKKALFLQRRLTRTNAERRSAP
jgi:hypothetical protein